MPGLALLLHTHMPYVEGFGTWPHGEEWLFEAMATSYLPLADVLRAPEARPSGRRDGSGDAPLTVSVTPVLADQLQSAEVVERFPAFLRGVRRETHRLDAAEARARGGPAVAAEVGRGAGDYEAALARFEAGGGDLLRALRPAWTSAATHAVLPLLATD